MNAPSTCLLNISRHSDYTTSLGSLSQYLAAFQWKNLYQYPPESPWTNFRPFLLVLSLVILGEEADPHLITTSWGAVGVIMLPLSPLLFLPFMIGTREFPVNLLALFSSSSNKMIKSWSADFQRTDLASWGLQSPTGGVGGVGTMHLLDAGVPSHLI